MSAKNIYKKKTVKRVRATQTITFQPDPDVLEMLEPILKEKPTGYRTIVLNEALRLKLKKADKIHQAAKEAHQRALDEGRAEEQG